MKRSKADMAAMQLKELEGKNAPQRGRGGRDE